LAGIAICWDEGSGALLRKRKGRGRVLNPKAIAYYLSLFRKHPERES